MTPEEFKTLASQGYNRIPVSRVVLADLDTPVSTFIKLADGPYSYLFESVHGGEKWGRYSIIGLPCATVLRINGHDITLLQDNEVIESATSDDPLAWVEAFQSRYRAPELPGGVWGDRGEHVAVAQVKMPVVGSGDRQFHAGGAPLGFEKGPPGAPRFAVSISQNPAFEVASIFPSPVSRPVLFRRPWCRDFRRGFQPAHQPAPGHSTCANPGP